MRMLNFMLPSAADPATKIALNAYADIARENRALAGESNAAQFVFLANSDKFAPLRKDSRVHAILEKAGRSRSTRPT